MSPTRAAASVALTAALVALLSSSVSAQVNIERLRRARAAGLGGELNTAFAWRAGNTRLVQFELGGRADYTAPDWNVFVVGRSDAGFANGRRYSNAALLHVRSFRRLTRASGAEAFAQMNYDVPRRLDWRYLAGGGARIELHRGTRGALWTGSSLMVEHERLGLAAAATHPRRTTALRWSNYLSGRMGRDGGAAFTGAAYVQPWLADFADLRVLVDATVAAPLSSRANLTLQLGLRYDGRPPDQVRRLDSELRQGMAITF